MPPCHIDVGMTSSRRHGMMVEMHSHKNVSLGTFNLECQLHSDTQVKESVIYKTIFVINITIYMCLQHSNVFPNLNLYFSYF